MYDKNFIGKNMLVVKDNALINASYSLDLVEYRLILLAIVEARENGTGISLSDPLSIHASTYIDKFKVEKHSAYESLQNACKSLFARQFSYQEISENGNITQYTSRWLSKIGYTKNEATVKLVFSSDVVSLITRLEQHFTSYELEQVAQLQSKYAARLYELLIQWKNLGGKVKISLIDLRLKLGILESEYKIISNFKLRVLDVAISQINEHTDIIASYEQHKQGRTITGFSFRFKLKKDKLKTVKDSASVKQVQKAKKNYDVINKNITKKSSNNANVSDLEHRSSKIVGLIMSHQLSARFKQADESVIQMMKRVKAEIITDQIADQWQSKLEEFGIIFNEENNNERSEKS